jgi:hypothetical protein
MSSEPNSRVLSVFDLRSRREVHLMDHETRHEFDRLLHGFDSALAEVRIATNDDEALRAWRRVQAFGHELSALLPAA